MEQLTLEASAEFAHAAHAQLPVWSGMAASSLQPLAREGGRPLPDVTPLGRPPNYNGDRRSAGRAAGQTAYKIKTGRTRFSLEFRIPDSIYHWQLQDEDNIGRSPRAPWYAIRAGQRAFNAYMKSRRRRVVFDAVRSGFKIKRGQRLG